MGHPHYQKCSFFCSCCKQPTCSSKSKWVGEPDYPLSCYVFIVFCCFFYVFYIPNGAMKIWFPVLLTQFIKSWLSIFSCLISSQITSWTLWLLLIIVVSQVGETETAKLEVHFIGNPRPEVIWTRDGEELVNSRWSNIFTFIKLICQVSQGSTPSHLIHPIHPQTCPSTWEGRTEHPGLDQLHGRNGRRISDGGGERVLFLSVIKWVL